MPQSWSEGELEILRELIDSLHFSVLVKNYNIMAGKQGYPKRTRKAIEVKIRRIGGTLRCQHPIDYLSASDLSRLLNVSIPVIRRWYRYGLKSYPTKNQGFRFITRRDFKVFAKEHPYRLKDCDREGLAYLLDSEKLLKKVEESTAPTRRGRILPVQCVESGQIFPSTGAAAKSVYVARITICWAITKNRTAAGYHWRYAAL